MKVLLAGALWGDRTPIDSALKRHRHDVFGLVRSTESTRMLAEMDAEGFIGDALEAALVPAGITRFRP